MWKILASDGDAEKAWSQSSTATVHCDRELGWRMDRRHPQSEELKVSWSER